ncbi:hypothetical protein [Oceanobacillus kimchii]|uniref:Uncharacterized protein n=1 Tax=Oceanobacillus kimchii TaxID=746691 RepID=A0ABQ5TIY2_9BACI|nr:hypothetical protein [Oceanobacillus kimchii]GLO66241.1 hypothetical protein MACH08_20250 [Oceanobacillus kimchii]
MAFKLPEYLQEIKEQRYELQNVNYKGQKIHPESFEDQSVTKEMISQMTMNSYGQEKMFKKYNNELLIEKAKYYLTQVSRPNYPCSTYDESLVHNIVPELIKRLEEETNATFRNI